MIRIALIATIVLAAGCSTEAAKRVAYETVEAYGQGQCVQDPSRTCEKQSYDEYRRQREEIDKR